jgi:uncharacterized membrane protein
MSSRRWLYFGGFVLSSLLVVGAGLMALLEGLTALSAGFPPGEEFVLLAMLGAAAEWIVAAVVLALVALVFLVATLVSVLRNASLPRGDRLVSVVERLERKYPTLRQFDVSEKVEPTTEDRKQQLKQQYVDGELSDAEFEREMDRLLDDTTTENSGTGTPVEIEDRSR